MPDLKFAVQDGIIEGNFFSVSISLISSNQEYSAGFIEGIFYGPDASEVALEIVFCASVCQNTEHRKLLTLEERQNFIIEHICCCNWRFGGVEFSKRNLTVGVYEGLLINTTNALHITHVKRILRA